MAYALTFSPHTRLFFFFSQAEDGIRDHCVTGVQTCALPICDVEEGHHRSADAAVAELGIGQRQRAEHRPFELAVEAADAEGLRPLRLAGGQAAGYRSEERRVGKECRSRWSPYH